MHPQPTTRRLLVLQAVGWLPQLRQAMEARWGPLRQPDGLWAPIVNDRRTISLDELFSRAEAEQAAGFLSVSSNIPPSIDRMRSLLFRKASQNHQYKYSAALFEEIQGNPPRWVPGMLASAIDYMPGRSWPDTDLGQQTDELLSRIGLI